MIDTIKVPLLTRELDPQDIEVRQVGKDGVVRLSFSVASTYRVERFFGDEILDFSDGAVRLDRASRGAMPLLFNHNFNDIIGMVDSARVEKERMYIDAHLFTTERAKEVNSMIDGGLRNVSIGYRIHSVEEKKDGTMYIRDWEPYESTIATVPADPTVGIGRAAGCEEYEVRVTRAQSTADPAATTRSHTMTDKTSDAADKNADATNNNKAPDNDDQNRSQGGDNNQKRNTDVTITRPEQPNAVELEKGRKRAIENLCKANNLDEKYKDHWIGTGQSVEQVSEDILRILEERGKHNPQPASKLGLSNNETQRFSLTRAINAIVDKDWKNAPFELECSREICQKLGRAVDPQKFFVPFEVMERPVDRSEKRDLTVGAAGDGGYLVATDNVGFIEMLRNRSVAFRMGARRLSGLQASVTVPRQSAAATGYWLSTESTQITESQQTFVQMALSPKTVGAYTEISRQLLLQSSPGAEGIVTDDLAQVVAVAADLGVLNGSGSSGQPTGILNTSGIGSVTGTSLAYADVLEFQTDVATSNVTPMAGGYVTTPAVASLMMQRARFSNTDTPLWEGNIWNGNMSGFSAMSSNQIPSATMIFGDWQEVVVGEWGVLEVEVNPYANFQAGIIGVRAMYSMDVGVRRPFAFSSASSIT